MGSASGSFKTPLLYRVRSQSPVLYPVLRIPSFMPRSASICFFDGLPDPLGLIRFNGPGMTSLAMPSEKSMLDQSKPEPLSASGSGVSGLGFSLGSSLIGSAILVECFHAPDLDLNSRPSEAMKTVDPSSFSTLRALLIQRPPLCSLCGQPASGLDRGSGSLPPPRGDEGPPLLGTLRTSSSP